MGELLPIRRERGFAVPRRQEAVRAEKTAGGASRKTAGETGLSVSETLRQAMSRTGQAEESRRTLQMGEGVLAEVQEKLDRMAQLVLETAGEGGVDRESLQAELEKLLEEIDRMTGSSQIFRDDGAEGAPGAAQEAVQALPAWLTGALTQGTMDPGRLLAALGLDRTASGAQLLAALEAREGDPAADYLAALYLGAVIAKGTQAGPLDPSQALDGLRQLLEKVAEGFTPDASVALLTGGEYASLADFQEQFASGAVPGLEAFLEELLLAGGGESLMLEPTLLTYLAGAGGMDLDLMLALLSAGQAQADLPEGAPAAGADPAASCAAGAPAPDSAARPMSVMRFGAFQVMGRDLSGVTCDPAAGRLTVGGEADVVIHGMGQGEQAILLTGSGAVTVLGVRAPLLAVEGTQVRLITVGENVLGEVRLGENASLTLDGRGLLRAGVFRGGETAALRLTGGAVAVTGKNGEDLGTLTVPVVLDGPVSLAAQAASVRDPGGRTMEPFDIVWKTLLPGFGSVASMELDGRQIRMALQGGGHPDSARLWLAKGDLSAQGYPVHTLALRGRDESGHARTRYAYLRWDRQEGGFREVSMYPNPFAVTGGEQGRDWFYEEESHTLHILSGQVTGISGGAGTDARQEPFSGRIALADRLGALRLTLGGVVCRVPAGRAFRLGRENDVTLVLRGGTNNFFESGAGCAGISLGEGTSLHIDCISSRGGGEPSGTLTATGGAGCAGIGQDAGAARGTAGHVMIRGGIITGGEKPGAAGTVTIAGGTPAAGGGSELGGTRTWARMSLFLQLGEDAVILPQFPLSSRTLQLSKLRVSTREYARAAWLAIDVDRRWLSRMQAAYSGLSARLGQGLDGGEALRPEGPVRDSTEAGILMRAISRSAPILSDRAMQVRSLRSLEDVNRLLR